VTKQIIHDKTKTATFIPRPSKHSADFPVKEDNGPQSAVSLWNKDFMIVAHYIDLCV